LRLEIQLRANSIISYADFHGRTGVILKKDSDPFYVVIEASTIKDSNGKYIDDFCVYYNNHDITSLLTTSTVLELKLYFLNQKECL